MKIIQQIDTPGISRRLAFYDGILLVADRGRGIQVIVAGEEECRLVATIPLPSHVESLIATEHGLIIGNNGGGVMRLPLPRRLNGIRIDHEGQAAGELPSDLPAGNYRLVFHEGNRRAVAGFSLN